MFSKDYSEFGRTSIPFQGKVSKIRKRAVDIVLCAKPGHWIYHFIIIIKRKKRFVS